jgi:hypothetical protein
MTITCESLKLHLKWVKLKVHGFHFSKAIKKVTSIALKL